MKPYCISIGREYNPSDNFNNLIRESIFKVLYKDINDFNNNAFLNLAYDSNIIQLKGEFICIYNTNTCKIVPNINYRQESITRVKYTLFQRSNDLASYFGIKCLKIRSVYYLNSPDMFNDVLSSMTIRIKENNEKYIKIESSIDHHVYYNLKYLLYDEFKYIY